MNPDSIRHSLFSISLLLCLLLSPASAISGEPVFKTGFRVRLSEPGMFEYGPLEFGGPAISADGRHLVVGTRTGLLLLMRTDSGEVVYRKHVDGGISAAPLLFEESMFVVSENGTIQRHALCDGAEQWDKPASISGAVRSVPDLWDGEVLFVIDDRSVLHAIDADSGKILAEFARHSFAKRGLSPFTIFGYPSPLVDQEELYAGFETGQLVRFGLRAGGDDESQFDSFDIDWTIGPCAPGALSSASARTAVGEKPLCSSRRAFRDVDSSPVMTEKGLLSGCYCGGVFLVDPDTGATIWQTAVLGPSTPLVVGDRAFVTSADGAAYALDIATGKIRWTSELGIAFLTRPTLLGSPHDEESASILVVTGKTLYVLDLHTGKVLARFTSFGGVSAPPAVMGHTIFLLSNEGFLYRIDYFR